MRRMLACLAALIFASQLGATASAAEPPSSCLSAPNQVCLLEWAWQEAIAAPANGSAATGNQDPRSSELIGVVLGLPDGLQRSDWLVRIAAPSIADLPEYKQAIQSSLHAATPTAFLSDENFRVWSSLVGVAARIGLTDEARSALRQISDSDRAQIKASEARSRALIDRKSVV